MTVISSDTDRFRIKKTRKNETVAA